MTFIFNSHLSNFLISPHYNILSHIILKNLALVNIYNFFHSLTVDNNDEVLMTVFICVEVSSRDLPVDYYHLTYHYFVHYLRYFRLNLIITLHSHSHFHGLEEFFLQISNIQKCRFQCLIRHKKSSDFFFICVVF